CHAQVQNSLYSIPSRYVGQRLDVRLAAKIVRFYAGTELAKTHLRGKPGQRQTDWNDYPPEKAAFFQRTPTWCREQASQLGEHVRAAVDELLDQHHLHFLRQGQGIIRLAEKYGETRLDGACQRALAYGNPHYRTIKTILEKGLEPNSGGAFFASHREGRRLPARARSAAGHDRLRAAGDPGMTAATSSKTL